MNIYDFADIIGKIIIVKRYANRGGRFSAQFDDCETKHGAFLCSEYGNGRTPQEAINDYKNKIVGETLVFHAMSEDHCRQEYIAPRLEDI